MTSMIPVLLMMFWLILPPQAVDICALWLSQPALQSDVIAACPEGIKLEQYDVEFVNIWDGKTYCTANATAIYNPDAACNLQASLDNFRMEVVDPPHGERVLCSIESYNATPTRAEIDAACSWEALNYYDNGSAELRNLGPVQVEPEPEIITLPAVTAGSGLYEQPASAADLATDEHLTWLASRLIWYGEADQESMSSEMIAWQNQFDQDIYAAALENNVPARLLKRIIRFESQYWVRWENRPAGEIGMAQITNAAADQYLRWYNPAYPSADGYTQSMLQGELLKSLQCELCTLEQAVAKERENVYLYARILAAYRYGAGDWQSTIIMWNGNDYLSKLEG